MYKKFFPVLIFIMIFMGTVAISVGYDVFHKNVLNSNDKFEEYTSLYEKKIITGKSGSKISISDFNSGIVIVNFWASWCQFCHKEVKELNKLYKMINSKDLMILSINSDTAAELTKSKKIVEKYRLEYPVIYDSTKSIQNYFNVRSYPFTVIYKNGVAVNVIDKYKDFTSDKFVESIKKYLAN